VHGLDTLDRGKALFWIALGVILGGLAFTYVDRHTGHTKWLIVAGAATNAAIFAVLALLPGAGLGVVTALLALMGFVSGYSVLVATHGRSFYPDRLIGRGMTTVNCAVLFGAASIQIATGLLVQTVAGTAERIPEGAYRLMFGTLAAALLLALACYRRCPEGTNTSLRDRSG
jgi:MFS family permease